MGDQSQGNKKTIRNLAIFAVLVIAIGWLGRCFPKRYNSAELHQGKEWHGVSVLSCYRGTIDYSFPRVSRCWYILAAAERQW